MLQQMQMTMCNGIECQHDVSSDVAPPGGCQGAPTDNNATVDVLKHVDNRQTKALTSFSRSLSRFHNHCRVFHYDYNAATEFQFDSTVDGWENVI
jgi:hypothetical protein